MPISLKLRNVQTLKVTNFALPEESASAKMAGCLISFGLAAFSEAILSSEGGVRPTDPPLWIRWLCKSEMFCTDPEKNSFKINTLKHYLRKIPVFQ